MRRGAWRDPGRRLEPRPSPDAGLYRQLAVKLEFELANGVPGHSLLLTAPRGSSATVEAMMELGWELAENLGHRVLLVDGSFSESGVAAATGYGSEPGLADVLSGSPDKLESLVRPTLHERVFVLPTGGSPQGGSAALKAVDFRGVLHRAYPRFDYLLIQGPPLMEDPRALLFLPAADRVLLLALEGRTSMEDLEASRRKLAPCPPDQLGLILVRPPRRWTVGAPDGLR